MKKIFIGHVCPIAATTFELGGTNLMGGNHFNSNNFVTKIVTIFTAKSENCYHRARGKLHPGQVASVLQG